MNEKLIFVIALLITGSLVLFGGCEGTVGIVDLPPPDTTAQDTTGDNDTTEVPDSLKREIEDIVMVPAGTFWRGSSYGFFEQDETPQKEIRVDSFYIMKYEVTNEQYAQFLSETDNPALHFHGDMLIGRMSDSYFAIGDYANYPISYASWHDAQAFAEWYGGRLPTEAEWEKAARGDRDRRIYPWGDQITGRLANFSNQHGGLWPVGYAEGTSPYGCYDMVGNVWEWTSDWYSSTYYSRGTTHNPQGPESGRYKTIRGGGFGNDETIVRCSKRFAVEPYIHFLELGFRVAFNPDSVKPAE